jgi:RNA polymerase sigma-70 factor (ECF subfamily)
MPQLASGRAPVASRAFIRDERGFGELEQLLVRSGRGDVDAFADLYDHLAPRVFGLVTRLVPEATTAEAITCEAFVEAWRRSAAYDPARCSATAWVLVVAQRLALRARR